MHIGDVASILNSNNMQKLHLFLFSQLASASVSLWGKIEKYCIDFHVCVCMFMSQALCHFQSYYCANVCLECVFQMCF